MAALAGGLPGAASAGATSSRLLSYNCPEFLETIFAANYLGAIAMPINWRLAAPEVRYILEHSGARALVCDEALVDLADAATRGIGGHAGPGLHRSAPPRADGRRSPICGPSPGGTPRVPAAADDVHRLMYTSGTTGRPKGVMITHANLAWKNLAHIVEFGFTSADLGLACGPLYHVGALDLTTTTADRRRGHDDHPPRVRRGRGGRRARAVPGHARCGWRRPWSTRSWRCPTSSERDLSSVRVVINGGEKMPIPLIERIQRIFPSAWFADAYGLTETVSGDTFLDRDSIVTKLGSVGRPCLYLELDIWDDRRDIRARRARGRGRPARPEGLQGLLARPRRHRCRVRRRLVPHRGRRGPSTRTATSTSSTASRT